MKPNKKEANKLITTWLKEVGAEQTEVAEKDGSMDMVTKFESMARKMWQIALGYTEKREVFGSAGTKVEDVVHSPHIGMMCVIFERLEGRVPLAQPEEPSGRLTTAERVTEQSKKRIADAGGISKDIQT